MIPTNWHYAALRNKCDDLCQSHLIGTGGFRTCPRGHLLVLIAGITSFGGAMIKTGAAGFLADFIADATLPFGVTATMAALALLTILLTQSIWNAATRLTALPATGITHSGPR